MSIETQMMLSRLMVQAERAKPLTVAATRIVAAALPGFPLPMLARAIRATRPGHT